jgi:hypothetical protein
MLRRRTDMMERAMPTVQVNDIQMFYELRGEGQPLVLILG